MGKTKIEWCDSVWNPIRGCSRVSEGCRHCYAETMAARFSDEGQAYYHLAKRTPDGPRWTGEVRLVQEHLEDPIRWTRPRRIFVNSMSDLFHEKLSITAQTDVFEVMAKCPQHTFQVLTKRADQLYKLKQIGVGVAYRLGQQKTPGFWPLPNVWIGVSVEDQANADMRIPLLLQAPVAVRFVSCEPLLGPVNLPLAYCNNCFKFVGFKLVNNDKDYGCINCGCYLNSMSPVNRPGSFHQVAPLDWVICGGESGPGARPMHPDWARGVRDQCVAAGVAFHFKQWGEYGLYDAQKDSHIAREDQTICVFPDGSIQSNAEAFSMHADKPWWMLRLGKKRAGRELDGREWNEFPTSSRAAAISQSG